MNYPTHKKRLGIPYV